MDINGTTQPQTTAYTNYEMEYQIPEYDHCDYISDHLSIFLIGGIGVSLVSLIGMIGNILCAIVLSRPAMRTSTSVILFCLSACDFLFVSVALLTTGIPNSIQYFCVDSFESFYLTTLYPIRTSYVDPLLYIAQLGSTYFTVCVSMERFFVVYRPLMARPYCTTKNALLVSLTIAAFTILFTMPFWWEFKIESIYDENGSWTKYRLLNLLLMNHGYELYYVNWVCMFVYRIIPVTLLTLLNLSIYWKIRKANKMRESMTHVTSSEISLAKMLIWVVSIFLLCNLWELYLYVRDVVGSEGIPEFIVVSVFFFNVNSSVNFIIYSVKSKKFRLVFMEFFWLKNSGSRSNNNSPRRNTEAGGWTTDTRDVTISGFWANRDYD